MSDEGRLGPSVLSNLTCFIPIAGTLLITPHTRSGEARAADQAANAPYDEPLATTRPSLHG